MYWADGIPEVISLLGNYADLLLLMLDRIEEARELKALSEKVKGDELAQNRQLAGYAGGHGIRNTLSNIK